MSLATELPYFIPGSYEANAARIHIRTLVRSGADARRLHVPIRCRASYMAEDSRAEEKADEIERILLLWDDPSFVELADRADTLLDELEHHFTWESGNDMMTIGEILVPMHALGGAICRRRDDMKASHQQ